MYKIIGADGREYGPVSAEQLRLWSAEGRVNAQTKVQVQGSSEWKKLGELPEFSLVASAAPQAPAPITVPPVAPETNKMALIGFIVSLVSVLLCILAPLGIIFGAIGLSQIKQNPQQRGRGLAISAIAISIVVIVFSAAILGLFFLMGSLANYGWGS